ncbi:Uncharacterized protein FWK35_00023827 [Aphis craccivora]|uniref:Uncharacterized protein n=1 Tax=Aphis craccivora TaxID=307492 RepID=A0A6G0W0L4_APHCR|nr:Uncharacterized protein FWK35_00023827 [Aphis craccivora]
MIGAFYGKSKPGDSNEYLQEFVDELKQITNEGIVYKDKVVDIISFVNIVENLFVNDIPKRNNVDFQRKTLTFGRWTLDYLNTHYKCPSVAWSVNPFVLNVFLWGMCGAAYSPANLIML